jgi:hypothetical protein
LPRRAPFATFNAPLTNVFELIIVSTGVILTVDDPPEMKTPEPLEMPRPYGEFPDIFGPLKKSVF